MKMDEFDGKRFLATVRGADFAHAGEEESIDLVFRYVKPQSSWQVLDVGCGRGGTANYVREHGWGNVVGIDIDKDSIAYAKAAFPELEFQVCAMEAIGSTFPAQFDLIYLFNVFYAAKDKLAAMKSFRGCAKSGALLAIFDYVNYRPETAVPPVFLGQTPASLEEIRDCTQSSSWKIEQQINLDAEYIDWYSRFLAKFDDPILRKGYSDEAIDSVRVQYDELLSALKNKSMGGTLLIASAV